MQTATQITIGTKTYRIDQHTGAAEYAARFPRLVENFGETESWIVYGVRGACKVVERHGSSWFFGGIGKPARIAAPTFS